VTQETKVARIRADIGRDLEKCIVRTESDGTDEFGHDKAPDRREKPAGSRL
jgi:hypothetical protein